MKRFIGHLVLLLLLNTSFGVALVAAQGETAAPAETTTGAASEGATTTTDSARYINPCSASTHNLAYGDIKENVEYPIDPTLSKDENAGALLETRIKNIYVCTRLNEYLPYDALPVGGVCMYETINGKDDFVAVFVKKGSQSITSEAFQSGSMLKDGSKTDVSTINCQAIALRSGLSAIESYVELVYRWSAMILGAVCVLIIIVGGIMISLEGANPDIKGTGISMIKNAITGLVILLMAGAILRVLNPLFFT